MKLFILKILSSFKPLLEFIFELESSISKKWTSSAHHRLMMLQWKIPPQPEFFDHHIDLFYQWLKTRNALGWERGIYSILALKGKNVLELACGDGFNAKNFYSLLSKKIIACDFDSKAIKTAKKKNKAPNVDFILADIRTEMPKGIFENVIWDAAIEHFTQEETKGILKNIKDRLTPEGVLSGYTIVEKETGEKSLSHHEYEFKGKEDLLNILSPFFKNVKVFETIYPSRHNLYFWASDGVIPFDSKWEKLVSKS